MTILQVSLIAQLQRYSVPRIRSLLTTAKVEIVKSSHDCQGNSNHRLLKGEKRLAVKNERGWDNYCLACGKLILEGDATRIAEILKTIDQT